MKKSISRAIGTERTQRAQWQRVTTIGIDLSDRSSHCCAIGEDGSTVVEFRVETDVAALTEAFGRMGSKTIAVETPK